jgi:hypothetical protein
MLPNSPKEIIGKILKSVNLKEDLPIREILEVYLDVEIESHKHKAVRDYVIENFHIDIDKL